MPFGYVGEAEDVCSVPDWRWTAISVAFEVEEAAAREGAAGWCSEYREEFAALGECFDFVVELVVEDVVSVPAPVCGAVVSVYHRVASGAKVR